MKNTPVLCYMLLIMAMATIGQSQPRLMMLGNGCNFAESYNATILAVDNPSKEMTDKIKEILQATQSSIEIRLFSSREISNAMASRDGKINYITYNPEFVKNFGQDSKTKWAAYFLLAHEVGHHISRHNFEEGKSTLRYKYEFQADSFATVALLRLGAVYKEIIAGIQTFDDSKKASHTHPAAEARSEKIDEVYRKMHNPPPINEPTTAVPPPKPTPQKYEIKIDPKCLENKWNLLQSFASMNAIGDDEKITISFELPTYYRQKTFKICLVSNDNSIVPNAKVPNSINGIGENIRYQDNFTIVWNFAMEKYSTREVSKAELLRVYVYDMNNLPPESFKFPKALGTGMKITGGGLGAYGVIKILDGYIDYNSNYRNSLEEADLKQANDKFVPGQIFLGAGIVLFFIGKKIRKDLLKNEKAVIDANCYIVPKTWTIEPILAHSGVGVGLRFRVNKTD